MVLKEEEGILYSSIQRNYCCWYTLLLVGSITSYHQRKYPEQPALRQGLTEIHSRMETTNSPSMG